MPVNPRRSGRAVGIPDYLWDDRLGNYVDRTTGRMVKRAVIQDALAAVCDRGAETLARIAEAAQAGSLTPRQFYEAMQGEIRQLHNAAAALGKGGWGQMTPRDWGRVGRDLRDEYARLREFAQAIADGKLSARQAAARARLYADTAYRQYWRTWAEQQSRLGNDQERWVTVGDERVCPTCTEIEGRGWQPLGALPEPGEPHPGCRCHKEHRATKAEQRRSRAGRSAQATALARVRLTRSVLASLELTAELNGDRHA